MEYLFTLLQHIKLHFDAVSLKNFQSLEVLAQLLFPTQGPVCVMLLLHPAAGVIWVNIKQREDGIIDV